MALFITGRIVCAQCSPVLWVCIKKYRFIDLSVRCYWFGLIYNAIASLPQHMYLCTHSWLNNRWLQISRRLLFAQYFFRRIIVCCLNSIFHLFPATGRASIAHKIAVKINLHARSLSKVFGWFSFFISHEIIVSVSRLYFFFNLSLAQSWKVCVHCPSDCVTCFV